MSEKDRKLDWMYKGLTGHVDREEYLMGRKIDKTFELIRAEETGTNKGDLEIEGVDVVPQSIFAGSSGSLVTVDVMGKLREDPLFEIKKREIEKQKDILNNPVKMKKIKDMIKRTLGSSDSSSDSSDDSDDHRHRRHKKSKKKKHRRDRSQERSSHRRHRSRDRSVERNRDRDQRKSDSSRSEHRRQPDRKERQRSRTRSRSRERQRHDRHDERRRNDRHRDRDRQSVGTDDRDHQRRPTTAADSSKPMLPPSKPLTATHPQRPPPRPKLTPEELEKRRQQMMSDAANREQDRKERVESIKKEEAQQDRPDPVVPGAGFVEEQLSRSMNEDSLEKQIRGRSFKSQRSRAMDSNFARK